MRATRANAFAGVCVAVAALAHTASAYPPHPPFVQAPGYCTSIYTNCSDGCGQYPDQVAEVKLHRLDNAFQMVAKVRTYVKWCDPSYCVPSHGTMRVYGWIDWNGDREWQESERVVRTLDYRHLVGACQDTAIYVQTIPIPSGAVSDTTWMRLQARVDNSTDEWIDPCIRFGRCTYDNTGAGNTLDRLVRLDRPAVTKITVGGPRTPIFEKSDVVWQSTLSKSYELGPNSGSGMFAAGFSDGGAQLAIELESCWDDTSYVPKVICEYDLVGPGGRPFSKRDSLKGWQGTLQLDLPHRIKKDTLRLRFSILDEYGDTLRARQEIPLTLYTTYARGIDAIESEWVTGPQGSVTNTGTPKEAWLDRATEWASGDTTREAAARKMMIGIWNYGHGPWTYKDAEPTNDAPSLNHYWWLMTGVGGLRPYGDCFAVAQMWTGLLGALGVDDAKGLPWGGWFLSKADHVMSFDGTNAGNAGPWIGGDPFNHGPFDRWWFMSHMVGEFTSDSGTIIYFDPTLNHEFGNFPSDFIQSKGKQAYRVLSNNHVFWELEDGHRVDILDETVEPWGEKSYEPYTESPERPPWARAGERGALPASARSSGALSAPPPRTATAPVAQLQGPYTWLAEDADGDGRAEALRLNGSIRVSGDLADSLCVMWIGQLAMGATSLGVSTAADRQSSVADVICVADTGAVPFKIRFSGDDLLALGLDGAFDATILLATSDFGSSDSAFVTSPPFSHGAFGSDAARILGVVDSPIDSDGFGYINYIAADVTLSASAPTNVTLQGRLSLPSGARQLQASRTSASIPAGESVVRVMLDPTEIVNDGESGPYGLRIELLGGRGPHASLDTVTAFYDVADIDVPSAYIYVNEVFGFVEDTDGSGLADWFRMNLPLEVYEPGEYVIQCEFSSEDPGNPVIDTQRFRVNLPQTLISIPMRFDGRRIRASGVDGNYAIRRTRIFRTDGSLASEHKNLRTNQVFSHTVFDSVRPPQVHISGACTPGTPDANFNGRFDALTFDVPLLADSTGDVHVSGWLKGSTGAAFDYAETTVPAVANVPINAQLVFPGRTIFGRGVDGPYVLQNVLAYPTRNGRGVPENGASVASACATGALSFGSFERAGVVFGLVSTASGPLAGAGVVVDSMPPAEDFTHTLDDGTYRAFRRTPGAGVSVVRLETVAGVADSLWQIRVNGVPAGMGRRIELAFNDTSSVEVDFDAGPVVGVEPGPLVPRAPGLLPIAPNPILRGDIVRVEFEAPDAGEWTLRVVDVSGRVVSTWSARSRSAGRVQAHWNTTGLQLPSGCYWISLERRGSAARKPFSVRRVVVLE